MRRNFLLVWGMVVLCIQMVAGEHVIIDHHAVQQFDEIPQEWIEESKNLIVHITGQSHGRQIPYGLKLLGEKYPDFLVETDTTYDSLYMTDMLRVIRGERASDGTWSILNGEEKYWACDDARQWPERTISYVQQKGEEVDLSLWCWCWDIGKNNYCYDSTCGSRETFSDQHLRRYLNTIYELNAEFPGTHFIYNTSITDVYSSDGKVRVTVYNDSIRAEAEKQAGILFDQADIENWDSTDTEQYTEQINETTVYLRHPDYTVNPDNSRHTNDRLCIRKAKAFWVLCAKIAGWQNGVSIKKNFKNNDTGKEGPESQFFISTPDISQFSLIGRKVSWLSKTQEQKPSGVYLLGFEKKILAIGDK